MKVLIICGHPHLEQSVANAAMLEEYKQNSDVEIRRIGDLYPNFKINVAEEQKALLEADVIVWQFPVYWYGLPSIMKKWQEDVLAHGFAYGSGAKLGGKKLVVSATTGSPVDAYQPGQPQQLVPLAVGIVLEIVDTVDGLQNGHKASPFCHVVKRRVAANYGVPSRQCLHPIRA